MIGAKNQNKLKENSDWRYFCFALDEQKYGVGRIMRQNSLGHVAEIFNQVLSSPAASSISFYRLGDPVILDSYSRFDRKAEGDWRVVAHQENYQPPTEEPVRFVYGVADNVKLVDVFDNETSCPVKACDYPLYSPMGDEEVREHFKL